MTLEGKHRYIAALYYFLLNHVPSGVENFVIRMGRESRVEVWFMTWSKWSHHKYLSWSRIGRTTLPLFAVVVTTGSTCCTRYGKCVHSITVNGAVITVRCYRYGTSTVPSYCM